MKYFGPKCDPVEDSIRSAKENGYSCFEFMTGEAHSFATDKRIPAALWLAEKYTISPVMHAPFVCTPVSDRQSVKYATINHVVEVDEAIDRYVSAGGKIRTFPLVLHVGTTVKGQPAMISELKDFITQTILRTKYVDICLENDLCQAPPKGKNVVLLLARVVEGFRIHFPVSPSRLSLAIDIPYSKAARAKGFSVTNIRHWRKLAHLVSIIDCGNESPDSPIYQHIARMRIYDRTGFVSVHFIVDNQSKKEATNAIVQGHDHTGQYL